MSKLIDSIKKFTEQNISTRSDAQIKALAWARVSTDMQEGRGLSIPEQIRQIREYCTKNNIEIVDEYSEAVSAFRNGSNRIEFNKMLSFAKSKKEINAIIVHDFSRFSRDSLNARQLIRDLNKNNIKVISLNDVSLDTETVAGVYLEALTFAKNEAYSREVAFHTRKGCRANIQTRDPESGWCYKNGGQPLWGYKSYQLIKGEEKKGRPLYKYIWIHNDELVSGRPVVEWTRYCLVEMAAKGASLDELRDFCNNAGIPAPRKQYWGQTTWHSLLQIHCLLQYAGYGVWNVRPRNLKRNNPDKWVIVENAHPAIISEDDALEIIEVRIKNRAKRFDKGYHRSKESEYLLSGGLFTCSRCGSNLMGVRKSESSKYYICGSQPHRKGLGCGKAVYVPKKDIENEVISGMKKFTKTCADPKGFAQKVNKELQAIWESSTGYNPSIPVKIKKIDEGIENIRTCIEKGLSDMEWAIQRMDELKKEKNELSKIEQPLGNAPKISTDAALTYRDQLYKLFSYSTNHEKKRIIRAYVNNIVLDPESLEIEINYKIPEGLVNNMVAGRGFEPLTFGL